MDEHNPHVLLGLAKSHIGRRENEKAARRALDCVSKTYFYPMAHYTLGVALTRMKRFDNAVEAFNVAVSQNPNFSQAYRRLGYIHKSQFKDSNTANEYFRQARKSKEAEEEQRQQRAILPPIEVDESNGEDDRATQTAINRLPLVARMPNRPKKIKKPASMDPRESIVIVTGLPRSGTSLMMQMLDRGGLEILTDGRREPDEDNPRGYLEFEKVKSLAADNNWVVEAKGKVIKVVAQLLDSLPEEIDYKVIFMHRKIDEIVQSQYKMLERNNKSGGQLSEDRP